MLIGNDVVDLRAREARGKAGDDRFIRRVFTQDEAARIHASEDPDLMLWLLWAGKEAAFKIARKLRPGALFVHRAYEVVPAEVGAGQTDDPAGGGAKPRAAPLAARRPGCVRLRGVEGLEGVSFPLEWEVTASFVHCVAREPGPGTPHVWSAVASHEECGKGAGPYEPTERERTSARTAESSAVRRLARQLAQEAGLGAVEIVRKPAGKTFGPPRLFRAGAAEPLQGWDVSLSHDGDLAAAALCGPATAPR